MRHTSFLETIGPGARRRRDVSRSGLRRMRPAPIVVALVAATILPAWGCGGDDATDRTVGLSPAQILSQAIDTARGVSGYTLTLRMTASGSAVGDSTQRGVLTGLLDQGVEITGTGPQRPPDGALALAAKAGPLTLPIDLTKADGSIYLGVAATVARLDLPPATVARLNLDALRTAPLTWVGEPVEAGRERVDDTQTVHLTGRLDTVKASEDLAGALGAVRALGLLSPQDPDPRVGARQMRQLRAALRDTTMDVWIATADLQPRRVSAELRIGTPVEALPDLRSASIDLTTEVSDIGAGDRITPPVPTRTVKPEDLESLFGAAAP